MARRQDTPSSRRQPSAPKSVNKFAPDASHPAIGPFYGDGRRRAPDLSRAARNRRDEADAVAAKMVEGGLHPAEVYLTDAEIGDTLFALDNSGLHDFLGRPRRAWWGFADHAHTQKVQIGREYGCFTAQRGIDTVIQVVIRPPEFETDLADLASWHCRYSEALGDKLRYARKTRAPGLRWDLVSAEVVNIGRGGWLLDGHFHLTTRGADDDELALIQAYFERRGWTFWFRDAEDEEAGEHPVALAQYQAKGLAAAIGDGDDWWPDALAELRRQTRNIAMTRATGEFREWKTENTTNGLTVVEDRDGKPVLAPRRTEAPRLRRKLQQSTAMVALRLCVHDFGDGLYRRAIRVRAPAGVSLAQVAAVYDLTDLIKGSTAIPESHPQAVAPTIPPTPPVAPTATTPAAWQPADIPW